MKTPLPILPRIKPVLQFTDSETNRRRSRSGPNKKQSIRSTRNFKLISVFPDVPSRNVPARPPPPPPPYGLAPLSTMRKLLILVPPDEIEDRKGVDFSSSPIKKGTQSGSLMFKEADSGLMRWR